MIYVPTNFLMLSAISYNGNEMYFASLDTQEGSMYRYYAITLFKQNAIKRALHSHSSGCLPLDKGVLPHRFQSKQVYICPGWNPFTDLVKLKGRWEV